MPGCIEMFEPFITAQHAMCLKLWTLQVGQMFEMGHPMQEQGRHFSVANYCYCLRQ